MIVRRAEIVLFDAAEAAVPRWPIGRRAGDRRKGAGGRAEDRRRRVGARNVGGRHAEGGLSIAGRALAHDPAVNGLGRLRRILLALQHLDEVVGRPQGVAR